jgi:cation diffusion facilitator family transporter
MYGKLISSTLAAWVSVISNLIICSVKLMIGMIFRSQVLIADGIHNGADVLASIASLGSIKVSNQPADDTYPYGYGKAEYISSGIISIILMFASLFMLYQSIESLFSTPNEPHIITLIASIISLVWKLILYLYTIHVGRKTNSQSLIATAYDHLADVYTSIAAVLGIGITLLDNVIPIPYATYSDPVFGIIVSILVCKMAIYIGKDSIQNLMEVSLPTKKYNEYKKSIQAHPHVKEIEKIRARDYGHYVILDAAIRVPANLTVHQGNNVCHEIQTSIQKHDPKVREVFIYLSPWHDD